MSSIARWTYLDPITVWPSGGYDDFGQPTGGAPYLIVGSWTIGGESRSDKTGQQFSPKSVFYFEAEDGSELIPTFDDKIKRGDWRGLSTPPADSETIKSIEGSSMSGFGEKLIDWEVAT